ncbi:MAG: 30S ribosomal protein S8 [Candidatus Doudnabacteria bacterium RIFCSPLOWO2_02_FULL_49_13]|uniref:Small ribosomal subunit protein uS8 n=1 Tax=Candidatus Doudnabacteria bacterium RIFCSPHIGHO2_12_FULL_48_16 TaxID=1817838 RepID=A0A1F5PJG7_9BACT|nr:ribosomal protein S8 [uncultured bacterium]OGE87765.1 MAG: 30S ribosomal protein S8 [Candidatus Doudnabacteria bacterium RIFCSPHIGHO2_02_FULL_49_24]OGE89999.1 MAG: 30S ribosomal protein S8 [Candidatus Doudnabacteria bacterium RIFCSPHIGHO2_12_FULL_48_16]OGE96572.1 MAG: 30S ribosomal protein S8 [Candidatus Doudnabacteria bacterium RIFCSPLOWO2_01_FULL_49_40]OGF03143.1 MAG: 30S ribosomal protein S8 [Candidatus Doudnabacteria bacterium RIFCSPLOWO2_02_FULL_49_13]
MTMNDTISDMLTRIRNALLARKSEVSLPHSNFKLSLAKVLETEGWIKKVEVSEDGGFKNLMLQLKYDASGQPTISGIKRVSKPGQRIYASRENLPRVMGSMGTTVVSTSKGLMTDKEARKAKVGGEIVCQIW